MAKTIYKENTYKNKPKQNKAPLNKRLMDFLFKDERFQLAFGLLMIIFSLALLVAFVSYFFTGRADQSIVEVALSNSLRETGREVQNWLGLTGAVLSHVLIFKWFGIGAFVLIPLLFLVGWRLAFKTLLIDMTQSLKFGGFFIVVTSILLATLFYTDEGVNVWGGGIGNFVAEILIALFGSVFSKILVFFALVVFVIYFFQIPTTLSGDFSKKAGLFSSVAEEFKNVKDKFSEMTPKEAEKAKSKRKVRTSPKQANPVAEKNGITLEVVDENNEDSEETKQEDLKRQDLRKTRDIGSRKSKRNKVRDKNTKLELEIDASTPLEEVVSEDNPLNLSEEEVEEIRSGKRGIQAKIDFERKLKEQEERKAKEKPTENPKDTLKERIALFEKARSMGLDPDKIDLEKLKALHKNTNLEDVKDPALESVLGEDSSTKTDNPALFDPKLELSKYQKPTVELLDENNKPKRQVSNEELEANKDKIVETLSNYGIGISQIKATIGPTVTLYEIIPEAGVRISKIKNLEDDIALSLAALGIRIIAPIPGKGTIGIEVPNKKREMVSARSVMESDIFKKVDKALPIILGKSITNDIVLADLAKMPHLLMAGATGQGKSVGLNVFLASLIYKKHPTELKFVLVDPKKVELTLFNKIEKHFLAKLPGEDEPIITDTSKVVNTLNSLCLEMDNRYNMLKEAACRNIKEYNQKFVKRRLSPKKGHRFLPYIVLVIDELADLMMVAGKEVEQPIARLAQLARAVGIHLIVATQRPSVNVITGIIKANFPARLSFKVTSKIDSRTILDAGGAEQLVGMGDLLFSMGSDLIRLQCPFIDTHEVERICDYINVQQSPKTAYELPEFEPEGGAGGELDGDFERDALFEEAARIIVLHQQGSTSLLQRKLKLGYNRAGRIIDQLESAGIVGAFEGSKAREVLVPDEYSLERLLSSWDK